MNWILSKCNGPSGFSGKSKAEDVTKEIDGTGLTAIVTGCTSGIGIETARVLALRGVHVVMAVRNIETGKKVKENIVEKIPNANVEVMELDVGSMESVRSFASKYHSKRFPLNILILNAAVMMPPFSLSKDNIELQFATNHIGNFLLTNLLLDTMKTTAAQSQKEGRIVIVSSSAHKMTYSEGIRFDKISDESSYSAFYAYGQSKLANVLHVKELTRRFKEEGVNITANAVHPGVINTNLTRHQGFLISFGRLANMFYKSIEQGAATSCYVALHPQVKGISGEYFADNNVSTSSKYANDPDLARKLWDYSISVTGSK